MGAFAFVFAACERKAEIKAGKNEAQVQAEKDDAAVDELAVATFAGGCFWCVEAVFESLDGVVDVVSGYTGGKLADPTYKEVCIGITGHAEACQLRYDPQKISFAELLMVFFRTHDPTTLDRQGNDIGSQYRSAIYYHNDEQREQAKAYVHGLKVDSVFEHPVVTEITAATTFYPAETEHQDYYRRNPTQGYCQAVIAPKLVKFEKAFQAKLKKR